MIKKFIDFPGTSAPKVTSRSFPQRAFATVAYKTDGKKNEDDEDDAEDEMKSAVSEIKTVVKEYKADVVKKAKEEVDKVKAELDTMKAEAKAAADAATAKDATIAQIQAEIKEIQIKKGKELTNFPGMAKDLKTIVREMVAEKKDLFIKMGGDGSGFPESVKLELKVPGVITSASLSGQAYGNYLPWQPGMEPTGQTRFRDLVRTIQSDLDTVYYPKANSPVGAGSFGKQVTEGAAKAQVDRAFTMATLTLLPFAGYAFVSRQSLRNIPFLQSWLPTSMNEQLMDQEDVDFSSTLVSAATGISTTSGVTIAVERMIYFIKNMIQAKYYPTAIAVDPAVWAEILVTKGNTLEYTMPGAVQINPVNGRVMVLGVPIYPVNWLTGRRVIVGDWTKAAIVESEGLTFRQSFDVADNFIKNVVCFLIERVEGLAIFRGDAFISTTV